MSSQLKSQKTSFCSNFHSYNIIMWQFCTSRKLSCHGICQIVTWSEQNFLCQSKKWFLWDLHYELINPFCNGSQVIALHDWWVLAGCLYTAIKWAFGKTVLLSHWPLKIGCNFKNIIFNYIINIYRTQYCIKVGNCAFRDGCAISMKSWKFMFFRVSSIRDLRTTAPSAKQPKMMQSKF